MSNPRLTALQRELDELYTQLGSQVILLEVQAAHGEQLHEEMEHAHRRVEDLTVLLDQVVSDANEDPSLAADVMECTLALHDAEQECARLTGLAQQFGDTLDRLSADVLALHETIQQRVQEMRVALSAETQPE